MLLTFLQEDANRLLEMSKRISGLKEELFINNRKFIMQDDVDVIDPRTGDSLRRHIILVNVILYFLVSFKRRQKKCYDIGHNLYERKIM